jgi:hypothetical protein
MNLPTKAVRNPASEPHDRVPGCRSEQGTRSCLYVFGLGRMRLENPSLRRIKPKILNLAKQSINLV